MVTQRFSNDPNSSSRQRALVLARADEQLHAKLLLAREYQGMSQAQVAEVMGVTQPTVAAFERYHNDPKMSTVRRYAHAVGVTIAHTVMLDGAEIACGWTLIGEADFTVLEEGRGVASHPSPAPMIMIADLILAA